MTITIPLWLFLTIKNIAIFALFSPVIVGAIFYFLLPWWKPLIFVNPLFSCAKKFLNRLTTKRFHCHQNQKLK